MDRKQTQVLKINYAAESGWGRAMTEYPRVTSILKAMVLFDQDTFWLKPRYLRRGRLVDTCASLVAGGQTIEPEWFERASGTADDDRVEHKEVLPYLEGVSAFMVEHDFVLERCQLEVTNKSERYIGHLDWLGYFKSDAKSAKVIIDLKCGPPPPKFIKNRLNPLYVAYRRQTAMYRAALDQQEQIIAKRGALHLYEGTYKVVWHNDDWRDTQDAHIMVCSYHDMQQFRRNP